jgi:catechol 2,3-dioxygenase-like lactoylglutathione lyase family enzyme
MNRTAIIIGLCLFTGVNALIANSNSPNSNEDKKPVRLGNFSMSLAVKDVDVSRAFYEKLGFTVITGSKKQGMYILQNDASTIGVFEGHIEKNTLTYNPGWERDCTVLPEFDDVRDIQAMLKSADVEITLSTDDAGRGPAHIVIIDPDGNPILIDQHVARPEKK